MQNARATSDKPRASICTRGEAAARLLRTCDELDVGLDFIPQDALPELGAHVVHELDVVQREKAVDEWLAGLP
eukprot:scaffold7695_cov124-Isochrysis_galbana.AAC.9